MKKTMTKNLTNRGGKREGSGRKKLPSKRVTMTIVVEPETRSWLQAQNEAAGRVIERYLPIHHVAEQEKQPED